MHTPAPSSLLLTLLCWLPGPGLALYQVTQLLSQGVGEGGKIFKVLSEGLMKVKCIILWSKGCYTLFPPPIFHVWLRPIAMGTIS